MAGHGVHSSTVSSLKELDAQRQHARAQAAKELEADLAGFEAGRDRFEPARLKEIQQKLRSNRELPSSMREQLPSLLEERVVEAWGDTPALNDQEKRRKLVDRWRKDLSPFLPKKGPKKPLEAPSSAPVKTEKEQAR
jgi:hypothetical protein